MFYLGPNVEGGQYVFSKGFLAIEAVCRMKALPRSAVHRGSDMGSVFGHR